jgi:hypothetical protein
MVVEKELDVIVSFIFWQREHKLLLLGLDLSTVVYYGE